jgi:hypothetical protein
MRAFTIKDLNHRSALALIALLLLFPAAHAQSLSGRAIVSALRAGGYIILMRHASSVFIGGAVFAMIGASAILALIPAARTGGRAHT